MPEQDAKISPVIVSRNDEAPVHVRMPARLMTQQLSQAVGFRVAGRVRPPVGDGGARQLDRRVSHNAERLARRVVVNGPDDELSHLQCSSYFMMPGGGAGNEPWLSA
jgi:hypothetical protein